MIAGGGNIGLRVAQRLEGRYEVKIIEGRKERAELMASELKNTLVLLGDATDEDLLEQESIDEMDIFLALTNDDEDNIMAGSLAKRLGCKRVVALINRRAYAEMIEGGPIDIGISPAQVSIGTLLAHVRQGDVAEVHSLRRGAAEALELVAHGDANTSKVIGKRIDQIDWPRGVTVAAVVRNFDEARWSAGPTTGPPSPAMARC
jgi:trk system potassium uptake protein